MIAEYLQKVDPKSDGAKRDWVAIYDECASVLYQVSRLSKIFFLCSCLKRLLTSKNNVLYGLGN